MFVKAKVAHTQPGTQAYREEGEQFEHSGKLYAHVAVVKQAPEPAPDVTDANDKTAALVTKKSVV